MGDGMSTASVMFTIGIFAIILLLLVVAGCLGDKDVENGNHDSN